MTLNKICDVIKGASRVAILPHIQVDGDCIGSSFALALALNAAGKKARVILEEQIPTSYAFLGEEYQFYDTLEDADNFDTVICLDSGDEQRINKRMSLLASCKNTINIDHHITNTKFAKYNYIDEKCAATGEIIYRLITLLEIEITKEMATCLYVAIATDTGGFRYTNTTANTHMIASELLKTGIDIGDINRKIFETMSMQKLKLLMEAGRTIELFADGKVALVCITRAFIEKVSATDQDVEGLSSLPRQIKGAEVGILLTEKEDEKVKVSLRSNQYVDVSKIAMFFDGGGHQRASGCTLFMSIDTAKQKVIEKVLEQLI